jgi:hypothetical protein
MESNTLSTASAAEIRAWAREIGLPVGTRGQIPADLELAYHLAHEPETQDNPA